MTLNVAQNQLIRAFIHSKAAVTVSDLRRLTPQCK